MSTHHVTNAARLRDPPSSSFHKWWCAIQISNCWSTSLNGIAVSCHTLQLQVRNVSIPGIWKNITIITFTCPPSTPRNYKKLMQTSSLKFTHTIETLISMYYVWCFKQISISLHDPRYTLKKIWYLSLLPHYENDDNENFYFKCWIDLVGAGCSLLIF